MNNYDGEGLTVPLCNCLISDDGMLVTEGLEVTGG